MNQAIGTTGRTVKPYGKVERSIGLMFLLMLAGTLLITGCATNKSAESNRMASIVVTNTSSEQIEAAVNTVFKKHGFEEGRSESDELVFQRPGSVMSGIVYGDWYSGGVWERIKIYQRELEDSRTVVECDGYMVQEHEDPLFQKEKREFRTKKGHLQDLLNEVVQELKHPSPPPPKAKED